MFDRSSLNEPRHLYQVHGLPRRALPPSYVVDSFRSDVSENGEIGDASKEN